MRTVKRVVVVWILAFVVIVVWAVISKTPWAATVDPLTAGKSFTHWVEPFRELAGALLVAVPAVMLIRSGWAWFTSSVLGREAPQRVRVQKNSTPVGVSQNQGTRELVRSR
jgi:hypothetical protein